MLVVVNVVVKDEVLVLVLVLVVVVGVPMIVLVVVEDVLVVRLVKSLLCRIAR